jgi:hypothetical protein
VIELIGERGLANHAGIGSCYAHEKHSPTRVRVAAEELDVIAIGAGRCVEGSDLIRGGDQTRGFEQGTNSGARRLAENSARIRITNEGLDLDPAEIIPESIRVEMVEKADGTPLAKMIKRFGGYMTPP